jgi:2-iminobutanoate/2-iminopropanoate deaminase
MPKEDVSTNDASRPAYAYSQAVAADGLLFTCGMGPHDPVSGEIIGSDIAQQAHATMRNLQAILAADGLTFDDVVKATVHLADLKRDFREFDAVYREYVQPPYPVRTTVGSTLWDILVEIDVVALRNGTAGTSREKG